MSGIVLTCNNETKMNKPWKSVAVAGCLISVHHWNIWNTRGIQYHKTLFSNVLRCSEAVAKRECRMDECKAL
jgi:hypothetical protein